MNTIKFSHRYKKMPANVEKVSTFIKDVAIIDYNQLTPEQIEEDTVTVDGNHYPLPRTRLIWIKLWTIGMQKHAVWTTLRRWTPQKFEYYSGLVGHEVKIVIEEVSNG